MNKPISEIRVADIPCFASDSPPLTFDQVTFIYGPNGSGKSSITKRLTSVYQPNSDVTLHTYDREFANRLIESVDGIEGVYRVQDGDPDTVTRLNELRGPKGEIAMANTQLNRLRETLEGQEKILSAARKELEDECWRLRDNVPKSLAELAFIGLNKSKKRFTDECLTRFSEAEDNSPPAEMSFELLESQLSKVVSNPSEQLLPIETWPQLFVPGDNSIQLLKKSYTPNSKNRLTALIEKLEHRHWVEEGLPLLKHADSSCPFCQQPLPSEIVAELESLFDAEYTLFKQSLATLSDELKSYFQELTKFEEQINAIQDVSPSAVTTQIASIKTYYENLLAEVSKKNDNPDKEFDLGEIDVPEDLDSPIKELNIAIGKLNEDRKNQSNAKNRIKNCTWQLLITEHMAAPLARYSGQIENPSKAIEGTIKRIRSNETRREELSLEETTCLSRLNSTRPVMEEVKATLTSLDFNNFTLVPDGDDDELYRIVRDDGSPAGNTLSEGERTLISFLYFFHLVRDGSKAQSSQKPIVAAIDDPISSLDSQTLFAISTLCKILIEGCLNEPSRLQQLVFLTHNSYFHQELTYVSRRSGNPKGRGYYLLRKNHNGKTEHTYHEENPIKSTYNLLWQSLKEDMQHNVVTVGTQNAMRRIIETYFAAIGVSKTDIISKFEPAEQLAANSLLAWLDDGSHLILWDPAHSQTNLEAHSFFNVFRRIFDLQGQAGHYEKMMENDTHLEPSSTAPRNNNNI